MYKSLFQDSCHHNDTKNMKKIPNFYKCSLFFKACQYYTLILKKTKKNIQKKRVKTKFVL